MKAVDEEEIEEYKTRQSAALYSRWRGAKRFGMSSPRFLLVSRGTQEKEEIVEESASAYKAVD